MLSALAEAMPTARRKHEGPLWFILAANLSLKLHQQNSFLAWERVVRCILATMRAARAKQPKTVSYAQIRALKARDRQRDQERLARGEVTPPQLQAESAAVRNTHLFRILNLKEATAHYRVMNRRRSQVRPPIR